MRESDKTTRRPKEPFDSTLEDPIALTPDQLEAVVGGLVSRQQPGVGDADSGKTDGATTGARPPLKLL